MMRWRLSTRNTVFCVLGFCGLLYVIGLGYRPMNTVTTKAKLKETWLEQRHENILMELKEMENKPVYVNYSNDKIKAGLRAKGLESVDLHEFKSIYIRDPIIYSSDLTPKAPGKRTTKIISCFRCPPWYKDPNYTGAKNRDFKVCPYSECHFDDTGKMQKNATLVLFFPDLYPSKMPPRPPGQIWVNAVWENKNYYYIGSRKDYERFRHSFNWTAGYSKENDLFWPVNILAWRARETLLSDEEYIQIAKKKTKTAVWWASRCPVPSKRRLYINEMKKYVDIDVYGRCGTLTCKGWDACATMLNDTYKFYLAFENSFCKNYVTEKFFRSFKDRRFVIPVVRGGLEYERYFPPGTYINAKNFKNAKELGIYLKDLANDIPRYAKILKEKDKLTTLNYKNDWCDMCEMLHTNVKNKTIPDLEAITHEKTMCWGRNDIH